MTVPEVSPVNLALYLKPLLRVISLGLVWKNSFIPLEGSREESEPLAAYYRSFVDPFILSESVFRGIRILRNVKKGIVLKNKTTGV